MARALVSLPSASRELRLRLAVVGEPALVTLATLLAHGLNMFQYPALNRFDDEGTYLSQAWAVIREHRLAPYAYFYDHAPAGWIFLAVWMAITGGPHAFGLAADSGRTFMLLLYLAMTPLLYQLARKLGCPSWAAAVATLLFSVSPLAVYYERPVLLDNIMIFWTLVSLDLLLDDWGRLSRLALSGCCFGLAVLSKESAAFLLPAMIFLAVQQRQQHHGRFAIAAWLLPMLLVVSLYPTFALLRGELLPAGQSLRFFIFNVDTGPGLSLVDALRWEATRGGGGFFNLGNQFWSLVRTDWLVKDPVLFGGGALATLVNLGLCVWPKTRDRATLGAALLSLLPLLYLARGGVVFDFYVLIAIPFLSLNIAKLLSTIAAHMPRTAGSSLPAGMTAAGCCLLIAGYWRGGSMQPLYALHPAKASRDAVEWIKQHVPAQSLIVSDSDIWTDLHEPGLGGPSFANDHSHWKVGADPAIRDGVFHDDWRTVDYLILSPQTKQDLNDAHITVAQDAFQNAHMVQQWSVDGSDVELWKVDKPSVSDAHILDGSAAYIYMHFDRDGALTTTEGSVTSESQSLALLRAVWQNDPQTFDSVWGWTSSHLLNDEGLLSWLWRNGAVADRHTASDADVDTALALLMASKRWNRPELQAAGTSMVHAIWDKDVVTAAGKPYISGGDWAPADAVAGINPSYFAPYAYRVFQQVDPGHAWNALIDDGYRLLFDASSANLGGGQSAGLPPNWIGLERSSGRLVPYRNEQGDASSYGYDASRTYWRVALDWRWSADGRAQSYLQQAGFLRDETQRDGAPAAVYTHTGQPVEKAPSVVGDAGAMAALLTLDTNLANALYASQLVATANHGGSTVYWGDPNDLYAQEWGWAATPLYSGVTSDQWNGRRSQEGSNPTNSSARS